MPVSWNSELIRAAEARVCYHVSTGSSREFMWRKAAASVRAVEKDIRVLSSGRIVNMPRLRETTAQQELEAIIRGEKLVVPPEMQQALEAPPQRDFDQHPYLRRMEYRGGGFAILMAFELRRRQHDVRQYMFKSEIVQEAQPFCDISMLSTDGWVRSAVCGWASHRSLLNHRLMLASCSAAGGREEYSLTEDGRVFLSAMLRKWPCEHGERSQDATVESEHAEVHIAESSLRERPCQRARKRWAKGLIISSQLSGTCPSPSSSRVLIHKRKQPRTEVSGPAVRVAQLQSAASSNLIATLPTPQRSGEELISMGTSSSSSGPKKHTTKASRSCGEVARLNSPVTPIQDGARRKRKVDETSRADDEVAQLKSSSMCALQCSRLVGFGETSSRSTGDQEQRKAAAVGVQVQVSGSSAVDAQLQWPSLAASEIEISSQENDAETEIENSSQDDEVDSVHRSCQAFGPTTENVLRLLVDDRERLRDTDPRGLLERISAAVSGPGVDVLRQRLRLGDFAWVAAAPSCSAQDSFVLDCIVERKRISDLVGRSAVGAHVQQMRRMEACGLKHCFLLVEGDLNLAASCKVYDEALSNDPHAADSIGKSASNIIRSKEDIDDLCARLLVRRSRIGVIMTKDAECTARILAHLSIWLASSLRNVENVHAPLRSSDVAGPKLDAFEKRLGDYTRLQTSLRSMLHSNGITLQAADSICDRHQSAKDARDALKSCSSAEHRVHMFECLPSCSCLGEQICGALGVQVPHAPQPSRLSDRRVYVDVSPDMKRRVFNLDPPSYVTVHEDADFVCNGDATCFADISVRAESQQLPATIFCSRRMLVLAIPGAMVVRVVLQAGARLGNSAVPLDIATHAISALTLELPHRFLHAEDGAIFLAVVEGLSAAVLMATRQASSSYTSAQLSMLPRLRGLVELTTLLFDLNLGWRVRVHDTRPNATTANFVQTLILVAREEAYLPLAA